MVLAGGPFGLGPLELVIILLVLVMLFGATRLTDLGGSLGKGIREFRKNIKDDDDEEGAPPVSTSAEAPTALTNAPETVQAIKCQSCNALNPVGAKHCNQCGAAIAAPVS